MKGVKTFVLLAAVLAFAGTVVFAKGNAEPGGTAKPREVIVGVGNDYLDFAYLDEKGNLAGLEVDVLHEIFKLLPQYHFSLENSAFAGILVGVDSGKFDIAVHGYAKNDERQKKYLYANEPVFYYNYQFMVKAGRTDLKTIKDFEGKNISVVPGNNTSYYLEKYNAETARTPINLVYGQLDVETQIRGLEEGRFDAVVTSPRNIDRYRTTYGPRIEGVGEPFLPGYTYFIYSKNDTQLRDDVDGALKQLRESGKLKEISFKYFKRDWTHLVPELEKERTGELQNRTL
jgi:L-cystine transport system substrate-binding protein